MQDPIKKKIREQIERVTRNPIILNPAYLDDEQMSREGRFAVLTEIFNANVRNKEITDFVNHFAPILHGGHPVHFSVFGKPGTGKTITILYMLEEFEHLCADRGIPFQRYHLDLSCAVPCFRALNTLACLMGVSRYYKRGISLDELMVAIERHLSSLKGYVVIFIDEADNVRRDPDTFFKFLVRRLPGSINAKLILVFTSNRLSWTDTLDPRIASSLHLRETIFEPYNADSLQKILELRVEKALRREMVDEGVIAKIAALCSRNHGDARKAVDLLLCAARLASESGQRVTLDVVDQASNEMEREKCVEILKNCPTQLQATLYAALTGKVKGRALHTGDAYLSYTDFCQRVGLPALTQRAFTDLVSELVMIGVVRARTVSRGRYGRTKEIYVSMVPAIVEQMKRRILTNFDLLSEVSHE